MLYVDMEVNGVPLKVISNFSFFFVLQPLLKIIVEYSYFLDHIYHVLLNAYQLNLVLFSFSFQAFVDSGAQSTIISKNCAERCGYDDLL